MRWRGSLTVKTVSLPIKLGPLEDQVMRILWSKEAMMTVREVSVAYVELQDESLAYTTIATVLSNLYAKGVVDRQRQGRSWTYWATGTCSDLAATMMHEAFEISRHVERTMSCFVGTLTEEEARALHKALSDRVGDQTVAQETTNSH